MTLHGRGAWSLPGSASSRAPSLVGLTITGEGPRRAQHKPMTNNYVKVCRPREPVPVLVFFDHGDIQSVRSAEARAREAVELAERRFERFNERTARTFTALAPEVRVSVWRWYPGCPWPAVDV